MVEENGRRDLRCVKPITIPGPLCLVCHGQPENLSPEVKSRLEELYRRDQATGYAVNDLRGAVSIRIALPATRLAEELGRRAVLNIVMVGFLTAITGLVSVDAMKKAVADSVPHGTEAVNLAAFEKGLEYGLARLPTPPAVAV